LGCLPAGFADNSCPEALLDSSRLDKLFPIDWLLKAKELSTRLVTKSEMTTRIADVYFKTLHLTDTEFLLLHPDDSLNSIVFY
jgi:hypothetical protein